MILLHPSFPLLATALIIYLFSRYRPGFRFNWIIGVFGTLFSLVLTIYWKYHIPATFEIIKIQFTNSTYPTYTWLIDSTSLPIILVMVMLAVTILVIKNEKPDFYQLSWNLLLIGLGIFASSSSNPYTVAATWSSLTLVEILMTQPHKEKVDHNSTFLLGMRLFELFLILWASVISRVTNGLDNFRNIGLNAGIFLILACVLRIGLFPTLFEKSIKHSGVNSSLTFRMVCVAASFSLLARVLSGMTRSIWEIVLIVLIGLLTVLMGILALFATGHNSGRKLRLIGFGALALITILLNNPLGTAILGATYILIELFIHIFNPVKSIPFLVEISLLFLYLTGLPFSTTFRIWNNQSGVSNLWLIPCLVGYIILLAGIFKQYRYISIRSIGMPQSPGQNRRFTFLELSVIPLYMLIIGYSRISTKITGFQWGIGVAISILTIILFLVSPKLIDIQPRFRSFKIDSLQNIFTETTSKLFQTLSKLVHLFTSILEGDGGVLWSIVILVLFISLLTRNK